MKVALISVIAVLVLAVTVGFAKSDTSSKNASAAVRQVAPEKKKQKNKHDKKFRRQATTIAATVSATWTCESQRGVSRTPFTGAEDPWSLPRSFRIREKVLNDWKLRRKACIKALHAHDDAIRRLNRGLAGSPMAGLGETLERIGRRYHISPYFMAAAAATESTLGAAACANNHMNVWGLSSCGSGWYVPKWATWEQAITFYANFLTSRWPTATSTYSYRGYAACSECWGRVTASHMSRLFGVGNYVRYP